MSDKLIVEAILPNGEPICIEYEPECYFFVADNGVLSIFQDGQPEPINEPIVAYAPGRWCQARRDNRGVVPPND